MPPKPIKANLAEVVGRANKLLKASEAVKKSAQALQQIHYAAKIPPKLKP